MTYFTNAYTIGTCCALCRYWYGEAVERYAPETGFIHFNDEVTDLCELHRKRTLSTHFCKDFSLEYIYSPWYAPENFPDDDDEN